MEKSKEEPQLTTSLVIPLDSLNIIPNIDKKKYFTVQTRSGAVWSLQPEHELDIQEWITTISEASKDSNSSTDYQYVTSKLFENQPLLSPSSPVAEPNKRQRKDPKLSNRATVLLDRASSLLTEHSGGAEHQDEKAKNHRKSKINAFFKRVTERI